MSKDASSNLTGEPLTASSMVAVNVRRADIDAPRCGLPAFEISCFWTFGCFVEAVFHHLPPWRAFGLHIAGEVLQLRAPSLGLCG